MGLIDIASSKSVWRGMEYYKQNIVLVLREQMQRQKQMLQPEFLK